MIENTNNPQVLLLITIEAFREQKEEDGSPASDRATASASTTAPASAPAPTPAPASTAQQTKEECLVIIKCQTAVASYSLRLLNNAGKSCVKKGDFT